MAFAYKHGYHECGYDPVRKIIQASHHRSEHPQKCPVTLRPFFMTIEHPELGMVATYGGPFDSYTIPEVDPEDGRFRCERYDHDEGGWVEGGHGIGWSIIREDEIPEEYTPPGTKKESP